MKDLKCFFTNVFDSVSRFLNEDFETNKPTDKVVENQTDETQKELADLQSQVEGAQQVPPAKPAQFPTETVPPAALDQTTHARIDDSTRLENQAFVPPAQPDLTTLTENQPTVPTAVPMSEGVKAEPAPSQAPKKIDEQPEVQPNEATQNENNFFSEEDKKKAAEQNPSETV